MGNPNSRHVDTWHEELSLRSEEEIVAAEAEMAERVWYDRHQMLVADAAEQGICADCAGLTAGEEVARKLEAKYGLEELEPCCDFCAGVLRGKLAALRWVLGQEWDSLDT